MRLKTAIQDFWDWVYESLEAQAPVAYSLQCQAEHKMLVVDAEAKKFVLTRSLEDTETVSISFKSATIRHFRTAPDDIAAVTTDNTLYIKNSKALITIYCSVYDFAKIVGIYNEAMKETKTDGN